MKIDSDEIAIPDNVNKWTMCARNSDGLKRLNYQGINLWDENGKVLIKRNGYLTGKLDHWLVTSSDTMYHTRHGGQRFESFIARRHESIKVPDLLYYHLKGMKEERGAETYEFHKNPSSPYKGVVQREWVNQKAFSFNDMIAVDNRFSDIPRPEDLGIEPFFDR